MNVIKCGSRVTSPRNKLSGCPGNVQLENKERAFFMDPIKRWRLPLAFQPNCFCPLSTPCRDAMGKQERASRRRRKQTATVAVTWVQHSFPSQAGLVGQTCSRLPWMWTSFQFVKLVWTEWLNVQRGSGSSEASLAAFIPERRHFMRQCPFLRAAGWEKNFGGYFPGSAGKCWVKIRWKGVLSSPGEASEGGTPPVLSWRMTPFSAKDDSANN